MPRIPKNTQADSASYDPIKTKAWTNYIHWAIIVFHIIIKKVSLFT